MVADANLNGCGIERIAAALDEHRIPFVIVTGYGRESLPPEVAHVTVLEKPSSAARVVQAVASLFTEAST